MEVRQLIYHLLDSALIDLKAEGRSMQNKIVFHLTNLCVSIPLALEQVTSGRLSSDTVLTHLYEQAAVTHTQHWLDPILEENYRQWKLQYEQAFFSDESGAKVCYALYMALIEIRLQGHEIQSSYIYNLADLFHTIPLALNHTYTTGGNYDELLAHIQQHAAQNGCTAWLEQTIDRLMYIPDTASH